MRTHTLFAASLALALSARLSANERWYILELDGSKAGWARESERALEAGRIQSETEMQFSFERLGQKTEVRMSSRFIETAEGEPIEMSSVQRLGGEAITQTWTFIRGIAGNEVRQVTLGPAGEQTRTLPWPEGDWLAPAAASRYVESRLADRADQITYETLDASAGLVVARLTQRVVQQRSSIEAAGKRVPAIEWETSNSLLPGLTSREFVDLRGEILRAEMNFGAFNLVMLASEKEAAISTFAPPEMMARTLVTPAGAPIKSPRETTRATYILSRTDEGDMPDLPNVGAQRAERIDAKRVRVIVERGGVSHAEPLPDDRADPYLATSTMIDAADEAVRALASEESACAAPVPGTPPHEAAWRRVELLRQTVERRIHDETLAVGFATASEVARTGSGDCTEHAVLLAALLRASDIGAQVASGLVLVNGPDGTPIFGYHMWTLARSCEGDACRWFDVDAAVPPAPGSMGVDATHITLSTSPMGENDTVNSLASLVGLLGTLRIEIVDAR